MRKADAALLRAAEKGDVEALRKVLQSGVPVDTRDWCGRTALHWAVLRRRTEAIGLLLEAHARTDIRDRYGHTALDLARTPAIRALLQAHLLDVRLRRECRQCNVPDPLAGPEMAL